MVDTICDGRADVPAIGFSGKTALSPAREICEYDGNLF
jgi:hypothetical protein